MNWLKFQSAGQTVYVATQHVVAVVVHPSGAAEMRSISGEPFNVPKDEVARILGKLSAEESSFDPKSVFDKDRHMG